MKPRIPETNEDVRRALLTALLALPEDLSTAKEGSDLADWLKSTAKLRKVEFVAGCVIGTAKNGTATYDVKLPEELFPLVQPRPKPTYTTTKSWSYVTT